MAGEAGPPWGRSGELQGPPPPRPGRQVAGRKLEREVARDARSRSVGRFPRGGGALPALAPRLGPATGRSVSGLPTATGPARPQGRYLGAPVTALGGGGREPAGGKRSRPFPRSRTGRGRGGQARKGARPHSSRPGTLTPAPRPARTASPRSPGQLAALTHRRPRPRSDSTPSAPRRHRPATEARGAPCGPAPSDPSGPALLTPQTPPPAPQAPPSAPQVPHRPHRTAP